MKLILSLGLAVCLMGSAPIAQHMAVLDFTVIPRYGAVRPDAGTPGIAAGQPQKTTGGIAPGMRPTALPVSITIRSVAPNTCVAREEIIYEVELMNRAASTIHLPWSVVDDDTSSAQVSPGYRKLTLALMADRPETGSTVLGHVSVASGSELKPGSLRAVQPGESVLLRAPAACPTRNFGVAGEPGGGVAVPVFAALRIRLKPDVDGASAQSSRVNVTVVQ